MSYRLRWTLWMTALGLTSAVVAYLITDSLWWALGAALVSGMVVNAVTSGLKTSRPGRTLTAPR